MDFDLQKIDALAGMLAAEMAGEDFDRYAACRLARAIRRDFPAIRETMDLVLNRLAERRH